MLQPPDTTDASTYGPPLDPIAPLRAALRGHYDIEREIGQGAFATVYLARDLKHERKVALKVLNADPTSETGELRFIREIRLLARLQHPNILPLHDSGHVEAMLYYVMPYVSGETLRDRIDREKCLSVDAACSLARDLADALAYAHSQGIIHRDIKPENILLSAGHPILADFGIARAIDLAGVRQLTRTGMGSPGTPAYMSPEQLLGDREIDGRSDTYSLGCVFYEMLTGKPPFQGKDGFVKRFTEPSPRPSKIRKEIPPQVDRAIERALERDPANRYQNAADLMTELTHWAEAAAASHDTEVSNTIDARASAPGRAENVAPAKPGFRQAPRSDIVKGLRTSVGISPFRRRIALVAVSVPLAAIVAMGLWASSPRLRTALGGSAAVDSTRFVVLPFAAGRGSDSSYAGTRVADKFYDAFSDWEQLPIVSDTRVLETVKNNGAPATESEALKMARQLGAGKLVWGDAVGANGTTRARVHLYDASTGKDIDSFVLHDSTGDSGPYSAAVLRLLGSRATPAYAAGGDRLTKSYPTWSAYRRGHRALEDWDLQTAKREFSQAIASDPAFPPARLWLAQILAWETSYGGEDWKDQALRATLKASDLSTPDRLLSMALSAMSGKDFPVACRAFDSLTTLDSLNFVGWYGKGDCRFLDSLVVPLARSPSSWAFRSNYHTAALDYIRAVRLEPGANAILPFDRLKRLLPTGPNQIRVGRTALPTRALFLAYPQLIGDSLLFIPYPVAAFANLPARTTSFGQNAALSYDASLLRTFAAEWTRQAPNNSDAFEALADAVDNAGPVGIEGETALTAIRRARMLASNSKSRARITAREVWLQVKSAHFEAARSLADSALLAARSDQDQNPQLRTGLTVLTGRVAETSALVKLTDDWQPASSEELPDALAPSAAAFFVRAAFGLCGDQTAAEERDLDDKIDAYVADRDRTRIRNAVKARPLSMMVPCTDGRSGLQITNPSGRLARMQYEFAGGHRAVFHALLDSAIAEANIMRPSDLSFDYSYQLAWLRQASGDTAGAFRELELSLKALSRVNPASLSKPATAASMVRAMILCAELADRIGNHDAARRWARAVIALWGSADEPLQPVVHRMKVIAGSPG